MRRLEVQFERFLQIGQRLFLSLILAGDVDFETPGNVPMPSRQTVAANGSFIKSFFHRIAL
jgi:hypothetical protein